MARNVAVDHSTPIGFFSLEMSSEQLVNRLIASEAQLSASKLRKGDLADHEMVQLHEKIKRLSEAPIFIDDTPGLSIFELRAKARRLVKNHGVGIIMIDYLQLMTAGGTGGNREQEISTISRSLKGIAKELKIPVIALSQVNRGVESRTGVGSKRPMLSDLRESGAIEQDADIVTFIYRPEYYKIYEWDNGDDSRGQGELIIAKHRNGSLNNVRLKFTGEFAKFSDLDYFDGGDYENEDGNNSSMISMSSSMNEDKDVDAPF
jgi:replicative DNA helicase